MDNLVFRKNPATQAIGRARKVVFEAEKKGRSPLKKNEPVGPGPPSGATETKASDSVDFVETEVELNTDAGNVELKNSSVVSPKVDTSINNIPPLLKGPITEYSRRMYKRVYGICPLQAESSISVDSEPHADIDRELKTSQNKTSPEEKTSNDKSNQNVTKPRKVAIKLRKQVKEFIKLGTNSVNKSLPNNSPLEKKTEIATGSLKIEAPKQTKSEPSSIQHLVIYCDGKEDNSQEKKNSPSVDINETINNILQNQRNGLYSSSNKSIEVTTKFTKCPTHQEDGLVESKDKTDNSAKNLNHVDENEKVSNLNLTLDGDHSYTQSKKKNCLQDLSSSKPNRLMENLNKRVSNKPVISPVTFGKLVSPEISRLQKSHNTHQNKINSVELSNVIDSADNLQRDNKVMSHTESNNSFEISSKISFQVGKKRNFLTSLFGESPSKSNDTVEHTLEENSKVENLGSPLSQNLITVPDSLVLPNSPSLDSDDPDDLVIDSSVCSRNTSPRVSESCEKDENNAEHMSVIPNKESPLRCVTKKQNVFNKTSSIEKPVEDSTKVSNKAVVLPKAVDAKNKLSVNGEDNERSALTETTAHKKSPKDSSCLPDLSDCLSVESKSQPEIETKCEVPQVVGCNENDSSNLAAGSHSSILPNETNPEFCAYLSHSSSSEVNSGNSSSTHKNDTIATSNLKRFIPSPSQLSLVSALRHSENSVFNIAEDTAGFVSALTRVRDISPIRTPDKKMKPSTTSDSQLSTSEVSKVGEGRINNSVLVSPVVINSIPSVSFQNVAPLEIIDIKKSTESTIQNVDCQPDNVVKNQLNSVQSSFFGDSKKAEFTCIELETGNVRNLKSSSTVEKCKDREILIGSNTSESPAPNNIFRRSRPVRRIILPNQSKRESLGNCNKENVTIKNSQSSYFSNIIETKDSAGAPDTNKESEHGDDLHQNIVLGNVELNSQKEIVSTFQVSDFKIVEINETEVLEKLPNNSINEDKVVGSGSLSRKVVVISPSNCEKKTFKRSNSIKTMPKPLPRINFDVLNRPKAEGEEDKCLKQKLNRNYELIDKNEVSTVKVLKNKKQSVSLAYKPFDDDTSPTTLVSNENNKKPTILIESLSVCKNNDLESAANKELEQSPHIANINKRSRISSFQRIQNSVKILKESKEIMKRMGKPCLEEKDIMKNSKLSINGNLPTLSCKISMEDSCKLEYHSKSQQSPKTNKKFKRNGPLTKMCQSPAPDLKVSEVFSKSCKIKVNNKPEPICQRRPCSQPRESQSKSPSPELRSKFNTLNENRQQQITESKLLIDTEKINKAKNVTEKPLSKIMKTLNTSTDNKELIKSQENCPELVGNSKSNQRRSLSNSSKRNVHNSYRSSSSSPEARDRSKHGNNHDRTESKSPDQRNRSKSCLQPKKLQSKSPETRGRSKSQCLKTSLADSPEHKSADNHYESSQSRSPDPKVRGYCVQRHPRSKSRESDYARKSERSSRSRHRSSYRRHSPKHYVMRPRSRSPYSNNRYIRNRYLKEHFDKQSRDRSLHDSRKRKSRSLSPEVFNYHSRLKRSRQSNRSSSNHQHSQSPNRLIAHDRKRTPQKSDSPVDNQEALIRLERLEKKFGFLTNQVHKKVSKGDGLSHNKEQNAPSFLDEIEEMKKEMNKMKRELKVKSPSNNNEVVSKVKTDFVVCSNKTLAQTSLKNQVSQSSSNKAEGLRTSENTVKSSLLCLKDLKTTQEVLKNGLEDLGNTFSVHSKPIPVIKYVKRRSRNLGDSDVTVVSSSSKLSKPSASISKPEDTKYS